MLDISVGNTELTITIHRSANNYLYFRVRDSEENILLTSNEFRCMPDCVKDIQQLKEYPVLRYEGDSSNTKTRWSFNVLGVGGRVLAQSPPYLSFKLMKKYISIVNENIGTAAIVDNSLQVRFFRRERIH